MGAVFPQVLPELVQDSAQVRAGAPLLALWPQKLGELPSWVPTPLGGQVAQKRERLLYLEPEEHSVKACLRWPQQPDPQQLFFLGLRLQSPVPRFRYALLLRLLVWGWAPLVEYFPNRIVQTPSGESQREVQPGIFRIGYPSRRCASLRHLRDLVRDRPDRASLEGTGVAKPRGPQGGLIPGKEATNDHATRQHQHDRERPYAFREPAGRTSARAGPREAKHHASQEDLALVRAHTARELPRGQAPLPRPRSADPAALHLLQRRGPGGERRGDL